MLMNKEADWCLKRQETLIEFSDQNTKFFQKISNYRRNINTISKMTNYEGHKARGLKDLTDLKAQHFKDIFKEPISANIVEIFSYLFRSGGTLHILSRMCGCNLMFTLRGT